MQGLNEGYLRLQYPFFIKGAGFLQLFGEQPLYRKGGYLETGRGSSHGVGGKGESFDLQRNLSSNSRIIFGKRLDEGRNDQRISFEPSSSESAFSRFPSSSRPLKRGLGREPSGDSTAKR